MTDILAFTRSTDRAGRSPVLAGPIRGELLGPEHLAERAAALARQQRVSPQAQGPVHAPLLTRLTGTRAILDDAHRRLADAARHDADVGPAGEWLLDNFHVVQEHIREVHESLPRRYYRELPELTAGPLAGYPRVYELAITLISHTEAGVDVEVVDLFVGAFQQEVALRLGELWAVPAMLRLGCIESVRRMALRTVQRLDEVELAERWGARIREAGEGGAAALRAALDAFTAAPPPLTPDFVSRLLQSLRADRGTQPSLVRLEHWIAEEGLSADDAAGRSAQRLALTQHMMANSITSLRAITHADWRTFVERQSVTEAALRDDPAQCYAGMTFATRDHYRHAVERIARRTATDEAEVARRAVTLAGEARQRDPADARAGHVGFWLVDDGVVALEREVGYTSPPREAAHRWVLDHPTTVFVGGLLLVLVAALGALAWLAGPGARGAWWLVLLVGLVPASEIAVALVNQLVTTFLPPRILPKMDLDGPGGVPAAFRTAVVVPTLLPNVAAVHEALEHLEVQFLANRDRHLHYALLGDFADADRETLPEDDAIAAAAAEGVRALNARYAPTTNDAFYLFLRPRRWNPQQGTWMGWERKRGKLGDFNRFVRGEREAFSTVVGDATPLRGVRYVITLDADTVLPPGTARLLVGALAHPLNRAVYDAATGRVVAGYGILQPRVGVSLPSAHRSRFSTVHSGHPGVDPYTTAVSDVYQDLFGEGSFTGKGIYDVDAFERATEGRFAENTLLSHDLIEGSYARAGLVTDITVYDDYPASYLSFTRRRHRWIRGDWQLLRWLLPRVPGPTGLEPNRLSVLSRWKIFDNLRRSAVEAAELALFVAGWTILPGGPFRWTLLALGAIAAPWVVALVLALLRPPFDRSWRAYYHAVASDAAVSAQQVGLAIAFLPHQAWTAVTAVARTLWRLAVSRRHLLEWQTARVTEGEVSGTLGGVTRAMAGALGLAAAVGVVVAWAGSPDAVAVAVPFVALWLASPALAVALSAPSLPGARRLSAAQRAAAMRYAKLHWAYFDRFAREDTHWLAPDNVQEDPAPVVAMRTSPTNVGLHLMAVASAQALGFIDAAEMARRLERIFGTLDTLPRHRGHFFNWYDLQDLHVLEPAYVSTVDSGNLAGCLLALRQACLAVGSAAGAEVATRLAAIADRAFAYVHAMDFRFLFDPARKLFSIGYQVALHRCDPSYYDLLASEARLASFIAIAKHDVPVDHWFHLGRSLTHAEGATALVSWSGSMFEYLMPALVMRSLPFTVLDQTYAGVLRRQVAYGAARHVPWGVSESAYNLRDRHLTYQYRAFGVPDLALKRGLGRDVVIAPYASALALVVDPARALGNLAALEGLGALGEFGFRDAIDYTRPDPGKRFALVATFMAHHVGMSLAAFTNALTDDVWQLHFHAEPLVKGAELLLHERIPRRLVLRDPQRARADEGLPDPAVEQPAVRDIADVDTAAPHVALLGRLPYTIMVSHCGSGYSRFGVEAVTRWRSDGTTDHTGQFCYVKDVGRGRAWSAAHQPVCAPADHYLARLATDRVTFERVDGDIETRTEIAVVPDDSAEVRRVTVTNLGQEPRELELTSYGEIVLAPPDAERAHPAFANLFVETEYHEWCTAITATRRPRSATETPVWCVHVVDTGPERVGPVTCETDRARFVGRGRSTRDPLALERDGALSGSAGAVLDPVFALRTRLRLAPGQSASAAFTTLVATSREQAFTLADRYHDPRTAQRALDLAWASTQVELRELAITPTDAGTFQEIAGHLLYTSPTLRPRGADLRQPAGPQPLLWAQGISGDWPILLAHVDDVEGLDTLRELFAAHRYWRRRGMTVDLVVLNTHPSGYLTDLDGAMLDAFHSAGETGALDQPGGVFFRRADQLDAATRHMLHGTARVEIVCDGRRLASVLEPGAANRQADADGVPPAAASAAVVTAAVPAATANATTPAAIETSAAPAAPETSETTETSEPPDTLETPAMPARTGGPLAFDNGIGGLTSAGEYEIAVRGDAVPPAPWCNVIAHERGGFIVSERGAGCTWAANSYFFRLTPWHNDPVSDPPSDVLYLRDEDTGALWSATPAPVRSDAAYVVRHGQGRSTFTHRRDGIETELTLGLADDAAVKLAILRVANQSPRPRRVGVTAYAEWTLGVLREHTQHQVRTSFDAAHGAILARNGFDPQFAGEVAFLAMSGELAGHTTDRREFLGRNGTAASPMALAAGAAGLSGASGGCIDPCAALQRVLELAPGEAQDVVVLLGAAGGEDEAARIMTAYREPSRAAAAVAKTVSAWAQRLSVVRVRTPAPSFDAMLNHWALYQALACRVWARSALYQSSGAYGFRDQLQDVLALLYAEPGVARAQLVRAAGRQFVEGDVQHWWHPQSGRGVRTRFSDDLVWLPYAVERYVEVTGDTTVLDARAPFLLMRALAPDEQEVYDLPTVSDDDAPVYDHCVRALRHACTAGVHGLPLIGSGDWNDGMNRVGVGGRGESVWLAWFLVHTLRRFASLAEARGAGSTAAELRTRADAYVAAVEAHAWDGAWYRRAYFDDGTPLGSASSDECRIDAIAQSWSVISGAGAPARAAEAMRSFGEHLVNEEAKLLLLLTPPFDKTSHDPGYIKGYLPGVRENGAQYTHAALWSVLATAMQGDGALAFARYQMINPFEHARTPAEVAAYKVEPYVVAADVYTAEGQLGRGGWTWYTGSASWMYRVGLENILGFTRRGDRLAMVPRVPPDWPAFTVEYRFGDSRYTITVERPHAVGMGRAVITLDGRALDDGEIPLVDDGAAHVVNIRPAAEANAADAALR